MKRLLHAINAALALALLAFSFYVYPDLPERIPTHFGVSGDPDAWAERSLLVWLTLPLIGVTVAALIYGVAAFLPARPEMVNLPNKQKLMELPEERQRWVLDGLSLAMYRMVAVMLVMFLLLQRGAYHAAVHGSARTAVLGGLLIGLVALPIVCLSALAVVQARLDRAHRTWRTGAPLPGT